MRRAESAFASGTPAEAEAIWQHLLTLDPGHPEALFHRGNRRRERGEHTAAIADYERALERVPGHAGLLNNLALTLEAFGKVERAEACYRDILTWEPQQPDALLNLANLRYRAARYAEAAARHQRAAARRTGLSPAIWGQRALGAHDRRWPAAAATGADSRPGRTAACCVRLGQLSRPCNHASVGRVLREDRSVAAGDVCLQPASRRR